MIEKLSFKAQVYERIKEGIITGEYPQGELLGERKLAEELGISRTPIREALQLLNKDGWVVVEPYKGTLVRTFDNNYIENVLDVRRSLEVLAIEKATLNATKKDIKALEDNLMKQEKCISNYSPKKFMEFDREFHRIIYYLSNNELLINMLNNINDIIRFLGIQVLSMPERHRTTFREHSNIYLGIKNENVKEAVKYMNEHMVETGNYTLSYRSN